MATTAAAGVDRCANGDLDRMIDQLRTCKPLLEADVKRLCVKATEILVEEGNVQQVSSPITMYGFKMRDINIVKKLKVLVL